jgi:hypothetical protein
MEWAWIKKARAWMQRPWLRPDSLTAEWRLTVWQTGLSLGLARMFPDCRQEAEVKEVRSRNRFVYSFLYFLAKVDRV